MTTYDIKLLETIIIRDCCFVDVEQYKTLPKIKSTTRIIYKCSCGTEHEKTFKMMNIYGALCKNCQRERTAMLKGTSIVYNFTFLQKISERDNFMIDNSIYQPMKLNSETTIVFTCRCGKEGKKIFKNIEKNGGNCDDCQATLKLGLFEKNIKETRDDDFQIIKYDLDLLTFIIERDKCSINIEDYNMRLTREKQISFTCNCGTIGTKVFRMLHRSGAYCTSCQETIKFQKMKETNIKIRGVENAFQCKEVQDKAKQTVIERYGVDNVFKSKDICDRIKATNLEKYGVEYVTQSPEIYLKIKETNLERYGHTNALLNAEIRKKADETNIKLYGAPNPFQCEIFKEKSKQTCIKKYGVPFATQNKDVQEKAKQTNLFKRGVEYPGQSEEVKEKTKQTCLKKYGVPHPSQNAEVSERASKNAYALKDFIFPCGSVVKVQGCEPLALQKLVDEGYTFEDIILSRKNTPPIWYTKETGTIHRYFCDIFIPKENRIIEVKSTWTYEKDKDDLVLKQQACKDAGYNFDLWIYDKRNELLTI